MYRASIVICVYNRAFFIRKCLDSVFSQDLEGFEVIVVDDGSTDGTAGILDEYAGEERLKVLKNEKNIGLMKSRNIGARAADSDIVAYVDSDCVANAGWLRKLVEPFGADPEIAVVGGRILDPPIKSYWELLDKGRYKIAAESGYVRRIIGTNMAIRKEILLDNPFSEVLKYGADETDLCLRLVKAGYRVYYCDEAEVVHFHRVTAAGAVKQSFLLGVGNCWVRFKHGIFPYLSLRSIILLLILLVLFFCPDRAKTACSVFLILVFVLAVFLQDAGKGEKSPKELITALPGRILLAVTNSAGYFYGVFKYLGILLSEKTGKGS